MPLKFLLLKDSKIVRINYYDSGSDDSEAIILMIGLSPGARSVLNGAHASEDTRRSVVGEYNRLGSVRSGVGYHCARSCVPDPGSGGL